MSLVDFIQLQSQILKLFDDLVENFKKLHNLRDIDGIGISIQNDMLREPFYQNRLVKNFSATIMLDTLRRHSIK